ncbi:MAG: carboxy terminal-processing peptidase [bacterium]
MFRFYQSVFKRVFAVFLLSFLSASVLALVEPLTYEEVHSKTALDVLEKLNNSHLIELPITDQLSREMLDDYVDRIDPSKSFFTQSDVDGFAKWRDVLDDFLRRGDLSPAFAIYNRYVDIAVDRYENNIALLQGDDAFPLDTEASLQYNDEHRTWPLSERELDSHWRKRITDSLLRLKLAEKDDSEARDLLVKRYKRVIERFEDQKPDDVFELFMNSLTQLFDPHTTYMSPKTMENFKISLSASLEGIGALLQIEDEYTQVVRVIAGGPADKQGILQAEDKIISVAQEDEDPVDVIGWRLDEVVDLIRGPKGTVVTLEVLSPTSSIPKAISITRDKVTLEEQSAQSEIIETTGANGNVYRYGVISVPAFYLDIDAIYAGDRDYKSTSRDVAKLIEELKSAAVDGVILDLRNNGGGYLSEATALTDLFIDPGPVVQIKDARNRISRGQRARKPAIYKGPLLVLINRLSASASEITAAAIQDYNRGLVVGETSFGKGTVQNQIHVLAGELKITESKFYRVSGGSTQHKGVVPDIVLPSFFDHDDIGESSQEHALPWDQIHSAPHRFYNPFVPVLDVLQANHTRRMGQDPDLVFLTESIDLAMSMRGIKEVSLNLQQRKQEDDEFNAAQLALENKRRGLKGQEPYPAFEDWKEATKEKDDLPLPVRDPHLYEAGNILADLMTLDGSLARAE